MNIFISVALFVVLLPYLTFAIFCSAFAKYLIKEEDKEGFVWFKIAIAFWAFTLLQVAIIVLWFILYF